MRGTVPSLPNAPPRRGAQLKLRVRGNFTFTFTNLEVRVETARGPTQSPIQWVEWDLSPGIKRLGYEADHSAYSAEVKIVWSCTSTPQYTFMTWCSVEA
jgi:hypothetical protein